MNNFYQIHFYLPYTSTSLLNSLCSLLFALISFSLAEESHDEFLDLHELFSHSLVISNIGFLFLVHFFKDDFDFSFKVTHFVQFGLFHFNIGID